MNGKFSNIVGLLGRHAIAIAFFVLFPAFVTAVAPVSWVRLERAPDGVTAHARTCFFFFVPYKSATVHPVASVSDRFVRGKLERAERHGDKRRSEDESFLVLERRDADASTHTIEVPVSPVSIKRATERAREFLADPQSTELTMFVVANWKFSVIAGGLVSLLTVSYVAAIVFAMSRGLFLGGRRLMRFALARDEV